MTEKRIAFIKSLSLVDRSFPLKVRDDPKYDNNPLINKKAIDEAVKEYKNKVPYAYSKNILNVSDFRINIEGRLLAENIPEIPSIVVDEMCNEEILYKTLNKNDITHIALSVYATGMRETKKLINIIQSEFKDIELYIGGVGTVYPYIKDLLEPKNTCIGNGINWLREKFNLKLLSNEDFNIPKIFGNFPESPVPMKTAFLITQLGCPNKCDFCITPNFLKYKPFSNKAKIIRCIEELSSESDKDLFLFMIEPNAFFPEHTWKEIFNYFIENKNRIDNNIFIAFEGSLNHINKFDLEKIQEKSPIKFLLISYGIESTLKGGYLKNQGNPEKIIERLNKVGIVTKQNYILGLPFHTKKDINLEIKNNLKYNPDLYSVFSFKPVPTTPLYNQLKNENRLYGNNLPPEFLYAFGFLPFIHEHLGGGFNILKHIFKALYENEKKSIDVYGNFSNKLLDLFALTKSSKIKWVAKSFMKMNKLYLNSFQARMPYRLTSIYKQRVKNLKQKFKDL
ncbi:MAG: hypothetical protein ACW98D_08315 [Promethearchaeota archaeon]|jgi:hypothetical protein